MRKKFLCLFVIGAMMLSMLSVSTLTASAKPVPRSKVTYNEPVYVDGDPYKGIDHWEITSSGGDSGVSYKLINEDQADTQILSRSGVYVVGSDYDGDGDIDAGDAAYGEQHGLQTSFVCSNGVLINGDVKLILADGFTLTVNGKEGTDDASTIAANDYANGVTVASGASLTIYGQVNNSGTLNANGAVRGSSGYCGIAVMGVTEDTYSSGILTELVINGGTVNATGASGEGVRQKSGSGIGVINYFNSYEKYGKIIINGGNVTAEGGDGIDTYGEPGLYSSYLFPGVINGGNITARGGDASSSDAGTGIVDFYLNAGNIIAVGGDVLSVNTSSCKGGKGYSFNRCSSAIVWKENLNLTAKGGRSYAVNSIAETYEVAGIYMNSQYTDLSLTIDGATVIATSLTDKSGKWNFDGIAIISRTKNTTCNATLTIKSGKVIATAGDKPIDSSANAVIGHSINVLTMKYTKSSPATPGTATLNIADALLVKAGSSAVTADYVSDTGASGLGDDINAKYSYTLIKTPKVKANIGGKETGFDSIKDAIDAADRTWATITLLDDVCEGFTVGYGQNIIIDLNGHIIDGKGTGNIANLGKLRLRDCSISKTTRYWIPDEDGLWILQDSKPAGTENVDYYTTCGACITGMSGYNHNGDILGGIYNAGLLTLNDICLVGNTADMGAAVHNCDDGNLTLNNCTVCGNVAKCVAGGISNRGTAVLNDCLIAYNKSDEVGGIWSKGTLVLNNTKVINNITEDTDNDPSDNNYPSAGVYSYKGTVTLINNIEITGNKSSGKNANMVIAGDVLPDVTELSPSSAISISKLNGNDEEVEGPIVSGATAVTVKCFTSDNSEYKFSYNNGSVSCVRPIIVIANSASKAYDGKPLTDSGFTVSGSDAVKPGDIISVTMSGSITATGTTVNEITGYKIMRGAEDVSAEYGVVTSDGILTVTPCTNKLTITAASASKSYDGTPLTNDGFTNTSGVLVSGDELTCVVSGAITETGTAANKIESYKITNAAGDDVTSCYGNIETVDGTLTVLKLQLTVTGTEVASKEYDKTTACTVTAYGTLVGVVDGDDVTIESAVATFEDATVGTGKKVTVNYVLEGEDAWKYTVIGYALAADINRCDISRAEITFKAYGIYSGDETTADSITVMLNGGKLTKGVDYEVSYAENVNAGMGTARIIVTGIGSYTGSTVRWFTIAPTDISGFEISSIEDQEYTGGKITPAITVSNEDKVLVEGTDYTVSFDNNREAGKATVTVTGIGNYSGTLTASFKIVGGNTEEEKPEEPVEEPEENPEENKTYIFFNYVVRKDNHYFAQTTYYTVNDINGDGKVDILDLISAVSTVAD